MKKRILSFFLVLCTMLTLFPVGTFAEDEKSETEDTASFSYVFANLAVTELDYTTTDVVDMSKQYHFYDGSHPDIAVAGAFVKVELSVGQQVLLSAAGVNKDVDTQICVVRFNSDNDALLHGYYNFNINGTDGENDILYVAPEASVYGFFYSVADNDDWNGEEVTFSIKDGGKPISKDLSEAFDEIGETAVPYSEEVTPGYETIYREEEHSGLVDFGVPYKVTLGEGEHIYITSYNLEGYDVQIYVYKLNESGTWDFVSEFDSDNYENVGEGNHEITADADTTYGIFVAVNTEGAKYPVFTVLSDTEINLDRTGMFEAAINTEPSTSQVDGEYVIGNDRYADSGSYTAFGEFFAFEVSGTTTFSATAIGKDSAVDTKIFLMKKNSNGSVDSYEAEFDSNEADDAKGEDISYEVSEGGIYVFFVCTNHESDVGKTLDIKISYESAKSVNELKSEATEIAEFPFDEDISKDDLVLTIPASYYGTQPGKLYKAEFSEGMTYSIEFAPTTYSMNDTVLFIYKEDTDGNPDLVSSYDSDNLLGRGEKAAFSPSESGTYYILGFIVTSLNDSDVFRFAISEATLPFDDATEIDEIPYFESGITAAKIKDMYYDGDSIYGVIYKVELTADTSYRMKYAPSDSSSDFDTRLTVFFEGNIIKKFDNDNAGEYGEDALFISEESGTYYIIGWSNTTLSEAETLDFSIEEFQITFESVTVIESLPFSESGITSSDLSYVSVDRENRPGRVYKITLTAGASYEIKYAPEDAESEYDTRISIFTENNIANSLETFDLDSLGKYGEDMLFSTETSGDYYIVAWSFAVPEDGTLLDFSLEAVESPFENATVIDEIPYTENDISASEFKYMKVEDDFGYAKIYKVELTAGTNYQMKYASEDNSYDTRISVFANDDLNNSIRYFDSDNLGDNGEMAFFCPDESAIYYIAIFANDLPDEGAILNFSLEAAQNWFGDAEKISEFPYETDYVLGSDDEIYYNDDTFFGKILKAELNKNDIIRIAFASNDYGNSINTVIKVVQKDGYQYTELLSCDESSGEQTVFVAPDDGEYYIILRGYSIDSTGECHAKIEIVEISPFLDIIDENAIEVTAPCSTDIAYDDLVEFVNPQGGNSNSKLVKFTVEEACIILLRTYSTNNPYYSSDAVLYKIDAENETYSLCNAKSYYSFAYGTQYGFYAEPGEYCAEIWAVDYTRTSSFHLDIELYSANLDDDAIRIGEITGSASGKYWSWDAESKVLNLYDGFELTTAFDYAVTVPKDATVNIYGEVRITSLFDCAILGDNQNASIPLKVIGHDSAKLISDYSKYVFFSIEYLEVENLEIDYYGLGSVFHSWRSITLTDCIVDAAGHGARYMIYAPEGITVNGGYLNLEGYELLIFGGDTVLNCMYDLSTKTDVFAAVGSLKVEGRILGYGISGSLVADGNWETDFSYLKSTGELRSGDGKILHRIAYAPSEDAVWGDIDGDGMLTAKDIRLAKRIITGKISDDKYNLDLNGDGIATIGDLRLLKLALAGKYTPTENNR